jgi:hypothetical protein
MYSDTTKTRGTYKAIQSRSQAILETIVRYIENSTYKCERASGENASECLSLLVELEDV